MTKPLSAEKRSFLAQQARRESARIRRTIRESEETRKTAIPVLRKAGYLRGK